MRCDIHWHEGLFLRPHHLQWLSRWSTEARAADRSLALPWPYGVIEATIADDALENRIVRFTALRAVMPSGLYLEIGANADLPSLSIEDALGESEGSLAISLAVPLWRARSPNAVPPDASVPSTRKELYRVDEADWHDENSGENRQQLLVRRINARLIFEGQDTTDLEVIPLLRIITHASAAGPTLRRDPDHAPPCLLLTGSARIREIVYELSDLAARRRDDLAAVMSRQGFSYQSVQGDQLHNLLQLRAVAAAAARLRALRDRPAVHPYEAYLELTTLLAELAALRPAEEPDAFVPYRHDRPLVTFLTLYEKIRPLAAGGEAESFWTLDFTREGPQQPWMADLEPRHMDKPNQYFLGVQSSQDPDAVRRLVEDGKTFKFMPAALVAKSVYGVKLKYEPHAPLPMRADLQYFRVQRAESEAMWNRIQSEGRVGVRWPGMEESDFALTLFMTIPQGG
jgi:type VI secretion system protein ImpJ